MTFVALLHRFNTNSMVRRCRGIQHGDTRGPGALGEAGKGYRGFRAV